MEIIKRGDQEVIAKLKQEFCCIRCNCVFRAEGRECETNLTWVNASPRQMWRVSCPECGETCRKEVHYD